MRGRKLNYFESEILKKIHSQLEEMEHITSLQEIKRKIQDIIMLIDEETSSDKEAFEEMVYSKVKETSGVNPELNIHLYMLYRNLTQNKISLNEAQKIYEMYMTEYTAT